jgi:hypothetical protein
MVAAFGTWGGWPAPTAAGTVGAVVVAVGLQALLTWREHRTRPKLNLAFDKHLKVDETDPRSGVVVPYLRVAVSNASGKRTADLVEVLIHDVREVAVSSTGCGGGLIWLANPALGWANSMDPLPRMSIPPGATRYLDPRPLDSRGRRNAQLRPLRRPGAREPNGTSSTPAGGVSGSR